MLEFEEDRLVCVVASQQNHVLEEIFQISKSTYELQVYRNCDSDAGIFAGKTKTKLLKKKLPLVLKDAVRFEEHHVINFCSTQSTKFTVGLNSFFPTNGGCFQRMGRQ